MIHHHTVGDARVTGVIEYSGPTHPPEFLYPAVNQAERDTVLKTNARWLAPNHYVPHMDRLIVTIQLWVVHVGGNVIVIDTGVGNRKARPAERMDRLNTLVMPWLEAADAGPEQVTHVVMTHMHTDHVGWHTVEKDGRGMPRSRTGARPRARHAVVPYSLARRGRPVLCRHPAQRDPDRAAGLERPLLPLARQGPGVARGRLEARLRA